MSSLTRRMQRAARRRETQRSGSAGRFADFGSMLGVDREQPRPKSPPRGSRRGKRNKAYIERRKAVST